MTELLKDAIRGAESLRHVARETGIDVATISRFLSGESTMGLDKADTLARFFGIECRRRAGGKKARRTVSDGKRDSTA